MPQRSDSTYKSVFLSKVRVEPERLSRYQRAFKAWAKGKRGRLTFADYLRFLLDVDAESRL